MRKGKFIQRGKAAVAFTLASLIVAIAGLTPIGKGTVPVKAAASDVMPGAPLHYGYGLTFSEEFNGAGLNTQVWMDRYFPQAYAEDVDNAACYAVSGGVLQLRIEDSSPKIEGNMKVSSLQTYSSSTFHVDKLRDVETFDGFTTKYGYFEMRAKLPDTSNGGHCAWWLAGTGENPEQNAEIDIMEVLNSNPNDSKPQVHKWNDDGLSDYVANVNNPGSPQSEFHTYGMLWEADLLVFYYDNVEIARTNQAPDYEMGMLLSLYTGTDWSGEDNGEAFDFEVDYIRVFQRSLGADAIVTYNDDTMDGEGLQFVKDGSMGTQFLQTVPQDPDIALDSHYIQFTWSEPVDVNQVVLSSDWCYRIGDNGPEGQAPTNWDIYVSEDGITGWRRVASTGDITWNTCDDTVESKAVGFSREAAVRGLRVQINNVSRGWEKYVIREIDIANVPGQTDSAEPSPEPTVKPKELQKHAGAAMVSYHDGVMNGMGLDNVNNGVLTDAYVSEDNPDMSDQFIQFNWDTPITMNQVILYSQYCGGMDGEGQAPTSWEVYVSENGTDGWEKAAESGTVTWKSGDLVQSKAMDFAERENVMAVRIKVRKANLAWNHYAVNEIEINDSPVPADNPAPTGNPAPTDPAPTSPAGSGTPADSGNNGNGAAATPVPTTTFPEKLQKHAGNATVSYQDGIMSGMGLNNVNNGQLTDSYTSEDNPDMSGQFIQFHWETPITVNQMLLYSQYCGAQAGEGQAPTSWEIYVSENGVDGWEKVAESGTISWEAGDAVQSKTLDFEARQNIKAVRVKITKANLEWNHYAVNEIEVNYLPVQAEKPIPTKKPTPTKKPIPTKSPASADQPVPVEETSNQTAALPKKLQKYAGDAVVSYYDSVMSGNGLNNVSNGKLDDSYTSEDNPDMTGQFIQFNWDTPISVSQVILYSQYCGEQAGKGQAPTSWEIYVSENGTDGWEKVAESGTVSWKAGDLVQSKALDFEARQNIKSVRIKITKANLEWNHYAVNEIEVNYSPSSARNTSSSNGDSPAAVNNLPKTGERLPAGGMVILYALAVILVIRFKPISFKGKRR